MNIQHKIISIQSQYTPCPTAFKVSPDAGGEILSVSSDGQWIIKQVYSSQLGVEIPALFNTDTPQKSIPLYYYPLPEKVSIMGGKLKNEVWIASTNNPTYYTPPSQVQLNYIRIFTNGSQSETTLSLPNSPLYISNFFPVNGKPAFILSDQNLYLFNPISKSLEKTQLNNSYSVAPDSVTYGALSANTTVLTSIHNNHLPLVTFIRENAKGQLSSWQFPLSTTTYWACPEAVQIANLKPLQIFAIDTLFLFHNYTSAPQAQASISNTSAFREYDTFMSMVGLCYVFTGGSSPLLFPVNSSLMLNNRLAQASYALSDINFGNIQDQDLSECSLPYSNKIFPSNKGYVTIANSWYGPWYGNDIYRLAMIELDPPTSFPSSPPSVRPAGAPSPQPSAAQETATPTAFPFSPPTNQPVAPPSQAPLSLTFQPSASQETTTPTDQPIGPPSQSPSFRPIYIPIRSPKTNTPTALLTQKHTAETDTILIIALIVGIVGGIGLVLTILRCCSSNTGKTKPYAPVHSDAANLNQIDLVPNQANPMNGGKKRINK